MKFSSREDIEASAEQVFAALTDFPGLELSALRRNIELRRLDGLQTPGRGMSWDVRFRFRGKTRMLVASVAEFGPPEQLSFEASSANYELTLALSLLALSKKRTRVTVGMEVRPRSLTARLMLQSARLGKAGLLRRYTERIQILAKEVEGRANSSASPSGLA